MDDSPIVIKVGYRYEVPVEQQIEELSTDVAERPLSSDDKRYLLAYGIARSTGRHLAMKMMIYRQTASKSTKTCQRLSYHVKHELSESQENRAT